MHICLMTFIDKSSLFIGLKNTCLYLIKFLSKTFGLFILLFYLSGNHLVMANSASICHSVWNRSVGLNESVFKRKIFNHSVPRSLKRYFVSKMYLSSHSQLRMLERSISENEILSVLDAGQVIFYKELNGDFNTHETKLAVVDGRPLHVVYNLDAVSHFSSSADRILTIVTVYEVDDIHWEKDLRTPKLKFNY